MSIKTYGGALIIVGGIALSAGVYALAHSYWNANLSNSCRVISETSPTWLARVPGSRGKVVQPGECGQWDGCDFHRIECPRAQ